jgi:hypothetical protein
MDEPRLTVFRRNRTLARGAVDRSRAAVHGPTVRVRFFINADADSIAFKAYEIGRQKEVLRPFVDQGGRAHLCERRDYLDRHVASAPDLTDLLTSPPNFGVSRISPKSTLKISSTSCQFPDGCLNARAS